MLYIKFWQQLAGNQLEITVAKNSDPRWVSGIVQKHTVFVIPLHFHNSPMKLFPVLRREKWSLKKLNNSPKIMQLVNAPLLLASVPCLQALPPCPAFLLMVTFTSNLNLCGPLFSFFFSTVNLGLLYICQGYFFENSKYFQKEVQFIIRNLTFQINSTLLKSKDQLPFFFSLVCMCHSSYRIQKGIKN